jgi:hypothetical protein
VTEVEREAVMTRRIQTWHTLGAAAVLTVSIVCASGSVLADGGPDGDAPRGVRASDDRARALVRASSSASPTIAALLDALADADVVVYVQLALTPRDIPGDIRLIGVTADTRYLLVRVSVRLSPVNRIALLGHELQHATEVAAATDVRDEASLARLMARIGCEKSRGRFETHAAEAVTEQVWREARDIGSR